MILLSETFMLVRRRNLRIREDFSAHTGTNFRVGTTEKFQRIVKVHLSC